MGSKSRKKKQRKAKGEEKPPKLKAVNFDFSETEERDARIAVEGRKPFSIRFRVPDGDSQIGSAARAAMAQEGGADKKGDEEGRLIREYAVGHLISWTLTQPVGQESFRALAKGDRDVAIAVYNAIAGAGEDSKNS